MSEATSDTKRNCSSVSVQAFSHAEAEKDGVLAVGRAESPCVVAI